MVEHYEMRTPNAVPVAYTRLPDLDEKLDDDNYPTSKHRAKNRTSRLHTVVLLLVLEDDN
jgi:hypothetical protein